ncbi:DNA polymerase III subunit tau [mine drainage metagenome]|uniref:DNA polymerase III subunit tau n=1 Tax=mine drainage metagenome TaxID=410659 RepID=A0A1J5T8N9_9ZZZZ
MLSASAFNAFLKTLEEPPSYAIFILATTEKHKILPTILSRCQIFDFKRITTNDTVEHLQEIVDKEELKADKASLQVIAQKSEGCMRDALSILDKIVSFTNGEVTYQNTIDNLNILDEDYYFKLIESLLQQDLAAALLLYDEINSKGFEGDMVLNGFAEFIRNILVCKDEKAASLLDVVEGMQEKYIAASKKTSTSYLVSALNILNEAEINFKMARNKRLHVELTLIKLNFLQQAIDLSVNERSVVKKKRIDGGIAFKIKPVEQLQVKTAAALEAKLMIEKEVVAKPLAVNRESQVKNREQLIVNRESQVAENSQPSTVNRPQSTAGPKKNLLEALREKYGDKYSIEEVKEAEELNIEKLQRCWDSFGVQLEQQQKHSSSATFKIARLEIVSENRFTATVSALTAQRFIEQEKMMLTDYIHQQFNNRGITFSVLVEEGVKEEVPQHMTMNSKQKFERIAEQYPMVKELKDKLKLELDY